MKPTIALIGIILLAFGVLFPGIAPLTTASPSNPPCVSTIYAYPLTNGIVGTTPLGQGNLVSSTQLTIIYGQLSIVGLPATYQYTGTILTIGGYVLGTSPTSILGDWNGMGASYFSSEDLGAYNSDGSCTNPGGFWFYATTTSSQTSIATTSTSSTSSVTSATTTTTTVVAITSTTVATSTVTSTDLSNSTIVTSTVSSVSVATTLSTSTRAPPPSPPKPSAKYSALDILGVALVILGLVIPRKWLT